MAKDTKKKKANPILDEEEDTDTEEDTEDSNEDSEDEVEEEEKPAKKPVKGSKPVKKPSKKAEADEEEDTEDEDSGESVTREKPKTRARNVIESGMLSDIERTKRALAKQPKVRIFIPLGIGEKKGSKSAVESVSINGFRQVLPKGEYISVAQDIADLIEQHYNMSPESTEMGEAFRLDRPRMKDGMSTEEALG